MAAPNNRGAFLRVGLLALVGLAVGACTADRGTVTLPPFGAPGVAPVDGDPSSEGEIRTVAMVGDSITVGSRSQLEAVFGELGLDVTVIDAESGRRIGFSSGAPSSGVEAARTIAAGTPPDLWVVALGTNDVGKYDADQLGLVIAELLAVIPPGTPVVWVDVYLAFSEEDADEFNAVLAQVLGTRPRTVIAPWSDVAGDEGMLSDGVHPTAEGSDQFAAIVAFAVASLAS